MGGTLGTALCPERGEQGGEDLAAAASQFGVYGHAGAYRREDGGAGDLPARGAAESVSSAGAPVHPCGRRRRAAGSLIVLCLLLAVGACSNGEDRSAPSSTTTSGGGSELEQTLGVDEVTTTTGGSRDVGSLPVPEDVAACVDDRLGAPDGEVPESEARAALVACQNLLVFAPRFVAGVREAQPDLYSEEELACVGEAFASLSPDDARKLLAAGLDPALRDDGDYRAVFEGLFTDCGAASPPPG